MQRERTQAWISGIEAGLQEWLDSARTPGAAVSLIRDGGHEVWKRVLQPTLDPEGELHELSSRL